MNAFIFVALFAAASATPDADPHYFAAQPYAHGYSNGYTYGYNGALSYNTGAYGLHPATASAINTYGNQGHIVAAAASPYNTPYAYHHIGKRSADAEPESDPAYYTPYTYGGAYANAAAVSPYAYNAAYRPSVYSAYNTAYNTPYAAVPYNNAFASPYAYGAGYAHTHAIGKRSAESDPESQYYGYAAGAGYNTYRPTVYSAAYSRPAYTTAHSAYARPSAYTNYGFGLNRPAYYY